MSKRKGKYEVGRGKPPKHTQFKPGQSGNPAGRPKGSRNFATLFREELDQPVEVTENGRRVIKSKRELLPKKLLAMALSGNMRAMERAIERMDQVEGEATQMSSADLAQFNEIIDWLTGHSSDKPALSADRPRGDNGRSRKKGQIR